MKHAQILQYFLKGQRVQNAGGFSEIDEYQFPSHMQILDSQTTLCKIRRSSF